MSSSSSQEPRSSTRGRPIVDRGGCCDPQRQTDSATALPELVRPRPLPSAHLPQTHLGGELGDILRSAADAGQRVRPVGAGHSFTPVAAGDDVMISLDHLSGIIAVDEESGRVRFHAGTRLRDIRLCSRPSGWPWPIRATSIRRRSPGRSRRAPTGPGSGSPGSREPSPVSRSWLLTAP